MSNFNVLLLFDRQKESAKAVLNTLLARLSTLMWSVEVWGQSTVVHWNLMRTVLRSVRHNANRESGHILFWVRILSLITLYWFFQNIWSLSLYKTKKQTELHLIVSLASHPCADRGILVLSVHYTIANNLRTASKNWFISKSMEWNSEVEYVTL